MNNKVKSKEAGTTNKVADKSVDKNRPASGIWLPGLISVLAIVLSVMVWLQLDGLKSDALALPSAIKKIEARLGGLESALSGTVQEKQQLQIRLATIQQEQTDTSAKLSSLIRRQGRDNEDWALAEIEHLLIIATHRLQLQGDVAMALAAMQAADDRLRDNSDPGLLAVRRQLGTDMNALNAVETVDITGLVLFLSDLVDRVDELPLQQAQVIADVEQATVSEAHSSNWEKLKSAIWQELKGLVLISRAGEQALATLVPEEQYFLYQNLRLQLESARYAVLRRDTDNLHVSVNIIRSWLRDYFATDDKAVANILESLSQMVSLDLNPPLPDISSSLETLRAYVKAQGEPAAIFQQQSPRPEQ